MARAAPARRVRCRPQPWGWLWCQQARDRRADRSTRRERTRTRTRTAGEPPPPRPEAAHIPSEPTLISSVQRALRLLEAVGAHADGAPAKQLAREAGLPLPTAYHLLRTLAHEGYLQRENGLFRYGDAVRRLGAGGAGPGPSGRLAHMVAALAGQLGVAVYFAVYREGEVDVLATADAPGAPVVEEWADFRQTAHAHAIGQCLLAQLDEAERADHFARYPGAGPHPLLGA